MKEKTLLRRFRWPLFIVLFASAQTAGLAYLYGDTHTAMIAFVVVICVAFVAVVLNSIDESPKTIEDRYK
jgi:predicted membrane channel-forming protein YqfA (hemolysin III family)